ncbi:MAG: TrkA family potassium uptake protein, partial [Phycisphaerae bacterium]|nr:TrkA family potassium uptake protein [Phycisphaerae bacterium]
AMGGVVLSLIASMVIEGQVRRVFGRRQLERKIGTLSGHVIVCGYGRMGEMVTGELIQAGRNVVVVDSAPERTAQAEQAKLLYVLGDAQDETVLTAAGIDEAEALIAALPNDPDNVFVTLSARQANPSLRIIARAQQASTQDKLLKAGATRVVCPQIIGASRLADIVLRPAVVDFFETAHLGPDLEMDELKLGARSGLLGKTLQELALPRTIGAHIMAVRRADGEAIYQPTPDLRLGVGDTLILVGKRGVAAAVRKLTPQAEGA